MKKTLKLTESELRKVIKESVNNILKEYRDIDNDNYYGGGLPDKYLDDEYNDEYDEYDYEPKKECDGYVVEDTKTNEVIGFYRNKENARKKVSVTPKSYFYGFNFQD
jgi:hypothetical protein